MINYKKLEDGTFELLEDYYEDGVKIAKGFIWDGASVPWWLRWLIRPTDKTKEGSMRHDLAYAAGSGVNRKEADLMFKRELLEDGVSPLKAWAMTAGVRLFGWLFYKGSKK